MPRLAPHSRHLVANDAIFVRVLWHWIVAGALLLALLPVTSWHNHTIGWLPYWLLAAPTITLGLLRRQPIAAALSAFLVRGQRRRKPHAARRTSRSAPSASLRPRRVALPREVLVQR